MALKILALLIIAVFYTIYIGKILLQKRKGIKTDQIAIGKEHNKEYYTEVMMKIATYSVVVVELVSIIFDWSILPTCVRIIGVCFGAVGDIVFAISVWTMRDNWRAGLAREDKTEIVTSGIYSISRNPAFLGFDLVYVGVLLTFFNPGLLLFSAFAAIMLHLQILQEEAYLPTVFGVSYLKYKGKVQRYLGSRR